MERIKYFLYDGFNIIPQKQKDIKEFKYNKSTLVFDFYNELLKEYNELKHDGDNLENYCYFRMVNIIRDIDIDYESMDSFLSELVGWSNTKIFCIVPMLPVGETFASYKTYKIIIHSNEEKHNRFPHVHIHNRNREDAIVDLNKLKIVNGTVSNRKDKKVLMEYIKEHRNNLIDYYNQIIEHKLVDKVVIDLLDKQ